MKVTLSGGVSEKATVENRTTEKWLKELPADFIPYDKFRREFNLEATSTEQLHPITKQLSQTMHEDICKGLEQLVQVDEGVIPGIEKFISTIEVQAPLLSEKLKVGGRIYLVGSGSSGRVGIDLAAKCNSAFPQYADKVRGVIAGGDSAMIRAREGFEDSEADGKRAVEKFNLGQNDTVILVSASGSASFNVGCGHHAADCGANVLYFYNSESIPERTHELFIRQRNPVIPLCVDIGPQAISGSTRLQGATLAEGGLGALLITALYQANGEENLAASYAQQLIDNMTMGIGLIRGCLDKIKNFIVKEHEVFSDPRANFRRLSDKTNYGYATYISPKECFRELKTNATEMPPTFSTNPVRRESEWDRKRAEYRAYLSESENNKAAWEVLLGRKINPDDLNDTEEFLLSSNVKGINSFENRPKHSGNILIGVATMKDDDDFPIDLITDLAYAKLEEGSAGLILLCTGPLADEQKTTVNMFDEALIVLENIPTDVAGLSETILLKQILNLISNGSMVMMNKVHGNQMIDVRASNKKLIDRCIRLVKSIWSEFYPDAKLDNEQLYHFIAHVSVQKKMFEEQGVYTPSIVKILLAMLAMDKTPDDFREVVDEIEKHQERIDWIGERKG